MSSVLLIEVFEDFFFLQRGSFFSVLEFECWVVDSLGFLVVNPGLEARRSKVWVRRLSSKAGFMINLIPILTACRNSGCMRRVR